MSVFVGVCVWGRVEGRGGVVWGSEKRGIGGSGFWGGDVGMCFGSKVGGWGSDGI